MRNAHNGLMDAPLLPLFPLSLVLLPGMTLPLHIFEERYKDLMTDVIPGKREFGVVLAKEDGIVNVGCTAVVREVLQRYPDGQLDLIATGQRRFEIEELNESKSFLRAEVQYFDDDDRTGPSDELRKKAIAACQELARTEGISVEGELQLSHPRLSFQLGQMIADFDRRQILLSLRSEVERLEYLIKVLPDYLVQRQRTALAKRVGPLNGHAKHVVTS